MGLIPEDAVARRVAAERATRAKPQDPGAWIALSEAHQTLVEEPEMLAAARRAVDLAPDDLDAIRRLAGCLAQSGPTMPEGHRLFERLGRLAPADPVVLHYLHLFAMMQGDYERAIRMIETLDRQHPGDPGSMLRIGRALDQLGDRPAAVEHYRRALARCRDGHEPFPHGPHSALEPVLARLAGDDDMSSRLSRELCQESGVGLADLSHPRYPKDCARSISQLQELVAGRDLFMFGFGPSLAEVVARKAEIASADFASITLSSFQIVEDSLLKPLDRRIDIVCMTHPTMARLQAPKVREWLAEVPRGRLTAPLWLQEHSEIAAGPEFLRAGSERVFWHDSVNEQLPPSPADPLHFPAINTLMCAMGVAVLARPRRVFLFGFDGRIRGSDSSRKGALYFREESDAYHAAGRSEDDTRSYTKATLWWDSLRFNEFAPIVLRHVALLFNLPQPPIFNVNVDSALEPFPRVTFDRFREIVSVDRDACR